MFSDHPVQLYRQSVTLVGLVVQFNRVVVRLKDMTVQLNLDDVQPDSCQLPELYLPVEAAFMPVKVAGCTVRLNQLGVELDHIEGQHEWYDCERTKVVAKLNRIDLKRDTIKVRSAARMLKVTS